MVRAATLADLARLFEMVKAMHAGSKYAARGIGVDAATAKAILLDGVRRHGAQHNGGTLLNVAVKDGVIEGFMLGILQRIYFIGDRLEAMDFWLYVGPGASATDLPKLLDRYITWADDNPKVAEICLAWTDAAGVDGARLGRLYERKGFDRSGEIYKRECA